MPTTKLTVLLASAFAIALRRGAFFVSSVIVPQGSSAWHQCQVGAVWPCHEFRHRLRSSRRIRASVSGSTRLTLSCARMASGISEDASSSSVSLENVTIARCNVRGEMAGVCALRHAASSDGCLCHSTLAIVIFYEPRGCHGIL